MNLNIDWLIPTNIVEIAGSSVKGMTNRKAKRQQMARVPRKREV